MVSRVAAFIIIGLFLLLLFGAGLGRNLSSHHDPAVIEARRQAEIARLTQEMADDRRWSDLRYYAVVGALLCLPLLAGVFLINRVYQERGLVRMKPGEHPPILRQELSGLAEASILLRGHAEIEAARRATLPQTLTYSPTFAPRVSGPASATTQGTLPPASTELPTLVTVSDCLSRSNLDPAQLEVILGIDAGGQVQRYALGAPERLRHIGAVGTTRSGKSNFLVSIAAQLAAADPDRELVRFVVIDHQGNTSQHFATSPHTVEIVDRLDQAPAMLRQLRDLVNERSRMSPALLARQPFVFILLEEAVGLYQTMRSDDWGQVVALACESLKSKVSLLVGAQALYSTPDWRIFREMLTIRSLFYTPSKRAAVAFGVEDMTLLAALRTHPRPGRAVLSIEGEAHLVQTPLADQAVLARLQRGDDHELITGRDLPTPFSTGPIAPLPETPFHPSFRGVSDFQEFQPIGVAGQFDPAESLSADTTERVRQLRHEGLSKVTIIQTVWGAQPGGTRAYRLASEAFDQITQQPEQSAN